jgi:hypothetical protein
VASSTSSTIEHLCSVAVPKPESEAADSKHDKLGAGALRWAEHGICQLFSYSVEAK